MNDKITLQGILENADKINSSLIHIQEYEKNYISPNFSEKNDLIKSLLDVQSSSESLHHPRTV